MSSATILPENRAAAFGEQLLAGLGVDKSLTGDSDHPALAWRRCGLSDLSGDQDGPAKMVPVPLTSAADGAMMALKALSNHPERLPANGSLLLGERARLMKLQRNGRSSPTGHCRLIDTKDGRLAINLARDEDWGLLEAWLEEPASSWDDVARSARDKDASMLVRRGVDLGLPVSEDRIAERSPWFEEIRFVRAMNNLPVPLIVDLSSLWAGPLAGNLLHLVGANVIKVESLSRPDGARLGNAEFYHLLNGGKRCAAFDFATVDGRTELRRLIAAADIVVEASRPRALRQLGIDAEELMREKSGKVWLRFMAHGDDESRIGFGDDIGVGAGLSSIAESAWGQPLFVGDAIADPLSGIFGAFAAWTKWQAGGGSMISLSMRDVVRCAMQLDDKEEELTAVARQWQALADADDENLYPMRSATGEVEELGASTDAIMSELC